MTGEIAEGTVFNPTNGFWVALAGNAGAMGIINVLVPFGQVGIGISLVLGLFTRFGGAMGVLMMLFFFVAAWDFKYGVVNQHLTYALVCAMLVGLGAGRYYGVDGMIADRVAPAIRNLLMSGRPVPATA